MLPEINGLVQLVEEWMSDFLINKDLCLYYSHKKKGGRDGSL